MKGNKFLEGSVIRRNAVVALDVFIERADLAECCTENSEVVTLKATLASARAWSYQMIQVKGFIVLPATLSTGAFSRCNADMGRCGSGVVIVRLTVRKKQEQIEYDKGEFTICGSAFTEHGKG